MFINPELSKMQHVFTGVSKMLDNCFGSISWHMFNYALASSSNVNVNEITLMNYFQNTGSIS